MQRDSSARERERLREEKDVQQIMGSKTQSSLSGSRLAGATSKPGFKKISTTAPTSGGTGWKTVGTIPKKSEAELRWGNNGEDEYDPAYPTPV